MVQCLCYIERQSIIDLNMELLHTVIPANDVQKGNLKGSGNTSMKEAQKEIYQNKPEKGFNVTDVNKEFCLLYGEFGEAYDN